MTKDEAERVWNLPKCERCDAMEARLRAAIIANESLHAGLAKAKQELMNILGLLKAAQKGWAKA